MPVKYFNFWYRWLLTVSIVMIVFGFFIAFFNQTSLFDFAFNRQIDPVFWNSGAQVKCNIDFQRWIYGVLGGTILGWGVFIAFITMYSFKARQRWSILCLGTGIGSWYFIDTSISIYYGVYFNAAFNTILLIAVILPVLFTKKYFS